VLATVLVGWGVLLGCAIGILAIIGFIARRGRRRTADPRPAQSRPTRAECAMLMAEAAQLDQQAVAAIASAERAGAEAERAKTAAAVAGQEREAAWQSIEAAQRALVDAEPHDPAVTEEIDPDVSRAAFGAYRRGDISVDQLQEVLRRSTGWDPSQEKQEHEAVSLRAAERAAHRRYYSAAANERSARKAAEIAEVAAQALAEEAAEAIEDARSSLRAAEECLVRMSGRKRPRR
jgi:hypothetical protein